MDYNNTFKDYHSAIERRLSQISKIKEPINLYEPVRYILSAGGKRIRPIMTMISCEAAGGDPYKAIDCACAIELLHNFTLIHDDIMDNSNVRRGINTVHITFGTANAILSGDVMVGMAYKLLPQHSAQIKAQDILNEFTKALITVCEGQALDMKYNSDSNVSVNQYLEMIEKKTAGLLESSAVIGALYANADENTVDIIRFFAKFLGIAFQLQDDLLDLTSNQETLGKEIGKDIIEGKKTYMIITAREKIQNDPQASEEDKILMHEFYKNNGLTGEKISHILKLFAKYDIFNDTIKRIHYFYDKSLQKLDELNINRGVEMLRWLTNTLVIRKY